MGVIPIIGGATRNDYSLKSGSGRLWILEKPVKPTFAAKSAATNAGFTAAAVTLTFASDPDFNIGDRICNPRTQERMVVTVSSLGAGGFDTVVVRGVDGTVAQPIDLGTRIDKDGHALRTTTSIFAISATALTVADYSANLEILASDRLVLRRGKDTGSQEVMYVNTLVITALGVKRNINLLKDEFVTTPTIANIAIGDFLFVTAKGYYPPEISVYLSSRYYNVEFKDTITIANAFDVNPTDSNERIGDNSANHSRYTATMSIVTVEPKLRGQLNPNQPAVINNAPSGMQEDLGYSLDTFFGEQMEGITMYIKGRESASNNPFECLFHNASGNKLGDVALGPEQRMSEMAFDAIYYPIMLGTGYIRQPVNC